MPMQFARFVLKCKSKQLKKIVPKKQLVYFASDQQWQMYTVRDV